MTFLLEVAFSCLPSTLATFLCDLVLGLCFDLKSDFTPDLVLPSFLPDLSCLGFRSSWAPVFTNTRFVLLGIIVLAGVLKVALSFGTSGGFVFDLEDFFDFVLTFGFLIGSEPFLFSENESFRNSIFLLLFGNSGAIAFILEFDFSYSLSILTLISCVFLLYSIIIDFVGFVLLDF